jgi:hypothetical protein
MKSSFLFLLSFLTTISFANSPKLWSEDFNSLNKIPTNNSNIKEQSDIRHTGNYGEPLYFKGVVYVKIKGSGIALPFKDSQSQRLYTTTFGIPELDKFAKVNGITKIEQVFPKIRKLPQRVLSRPTAKINQSPDLSNIYMLHFSADIDPIELSRKLSTLSNIEYAEPVPLTYPLETPNDTYYSQQQHLPQMHCPEAWDLHKGENSDSTIIIGICDTGVDWKHPDLINNVYQNLGEDADHDGHVLEYINGQWQFDPGDINGIDDDGNGYVDDFIGWNFYTDDGTPENDPMGSAQNTHGTHCAGISAGVTNNGNGIASVSWNVKFMATKHASNSSGNAIYNGFDGIVYLAENGADVINCSWGGGGYSETGQLAVNYATSLGAIVVAAAGNNNSSSPFYPAAYQNIVSVASVASNDKKAYYSNYGYTVDVAAPGGDAYVDGGILSTLPNNTYGRYQGTSMAAPQVTGLIGFVKSYIPSASNDRIIRRVIGNVDKIDSLNPTYAGMLGTGRINAYKALLQDYTNKLPMKIVLNSINYQKVNGNINIALNLFNYSIDGANSVNFTLSSTDPKIQIINPVGNSAISANGPTKTNYFLTFKILQYTNAFATLHIHLDGVDNQIQAGSDFDFQVYCGQNGILVYEKYMNGPTTSGNFIANYLTTNNYPNVIYTNSPVTNLIGFNYLFLSMGNADSYDFSLFDNNLSDNVENFLKNGGRVYLESGDALGYEQAGNSDLLSLFGISAGYDGPPSHTFAGLTGFAGTVTADMHFNQTTQSPIDWIDNFDIAPAGQVAFFEPTVGNVAVQNTGSYGQRTFAFSYALAKLTDATEPSTKNTLLHRILDFFQVYNQTPSQTTLISPLDNTTIYPNSTINLLWNSLPNAWNYELQIASDANFTNIVKDLTITDTTKSYLFTDFTINSNYFWRVRGQNNIGYGNWSNVWKFKVSQFLPQKVVLLQPINNSIQNTLKPVFSWQPSLYANYYTIQIAKDEQFTINVIAVSGLLSTTYTPSINLAHNTTYYWRVRGSNPGGDGNWSDTFATNIYMCAGAVVNLQPSYNTQNADIKPSFTWTSNQYADSYNLQIATNPNFSSLVADYTDIFTNQFAMPTSLNYNTKYYWRVRSYNNCGFSSWSNYFVFTTKNIPFEINLTNKISCKNQNVDLGTFDEQGNLITVTGGSGNFLYSWSPNYNLVNANTGNPTVVNPIYTTTYTLNVKDVLTGMTQSATLTLTIYPSVNVQLPIFVVMKIGTFLNLNSKIQDITGGVPPYTTVWKDNLGNIINPAIVSPPLGANSFWLTVQDANMCSVTKRLLVLVTLYKDANENDIVVGQSGEHLVAAYPNPVSDNVNILLYSNERTNVTMEITNMIGQQFYKENLSVQSSFEKQINVESFPQGVYLLNIYFGDEVISKKIIKQ